jgi:hypothetical protein
MVTARGKWSFWLGASIAVASVIYSTHIALRASELAHNNQVELRTNRDVVSKLNARIAELEAQARARQTQLSRPLAPIRTVDVDAQTAHPPTADSIEQLAALMARRAQEEQEIERSDRSGEQLEAFDGTAKALEGILSSGRLTQHDAAEFSKWTSVLHPDDWEEFRRQLAVAVNAGTLHVDADAPL